jgi:hypothetical protein
MKSALLNEQKTELRTRQTIVPKQVAFTTLFQC